MKPNDAGEPAGSPDEPEVAMAGPPPGDAPDDPSSGASPPSSGVPPSAGATAAGPPPHGKAGRNLPMAIGVGAALGALVVVSLYTVKEIFLGVMVLFLLLGMKEMTDAFRTRGILVPFVPLAAGMVVAPVSAYVWGSTAVVAAVSLTVLAVLMIRMPKGADGYVRDVGAGILLAGYLVLMGAIVALLMRPDDGDHRIVVFVAVTVASDIGGYFAGAFLGKHKMAPTISPKKTWDSRAACSCGACWTAAGSGTAC
jgi:CDP-diglyceride synthetase